MRLSIRYLAPGTRYISHMTSSLINRVPHTRCGDAGYLKDTRYIERDLGWLSYLGKGALYLIVH